MAQAQSQRQSNSENTEQFVHYPRKFKTFDKYDFVKSYVALSAATNADRNAIDLKEKEASFIADAIQENQNIVFENLATKEELNLQIAGVIKEIKALETDLKKDIKALETDLKKDIKALETDLKKDIKALEKEIISSETRLTIKVAVIVGGFLTIAPLLNEFIRHLFKF